MTAGYALFSGTSNPALAAAVAGELGRPLTPAEVERFPDGEVTVRLEEAVRGRDVFVVQPTSPPVDVNLVELLAFADASRRAGSARITAVIPYFGYARSDRRTGMREPIAARMVADLLEAVGVGHVVTVDAHTPQLAGFFRIPVDALSAVPRLARALRGHVGSDVVVVAPDAGRVDMAAAYAGLLDAPVAVLHKRRESGTETRVTRVVGDVRGRTCLLVDDMISTGGTLLGAVRALSEAGATGFVAAATHGLLLEDAVDRLLGGGIREIFVSDTVAAPHPEQPRLRIVETAPLLADAVARLASNGSFAGLE